MSNPENGESLDALNQERMSLPEEGEGFDALLDYLKRTRGFDFTGYKRASLARRIQKRMQAVPVDRYGEYIDYLEVHPEEFATLFTTILINVTAFFRDPPAWEFLAREVMPQILKAQNASGPVRVWSAGCASGEEAYSLAMLLAEAVGVDAFRERVKIYGTDVDAEALNQARQAVYNGRDVAGVPAPLLEKYFERYGERYVFHKDLRRSVIFGRHDLIQDAPISRLDLLVCRNTLMYFNAETQARVLDRFLFALNDRGYLFLGKAEMLLSHCAAFTPQDLKCRVFVKTPRDAPGDRVWGGGGDAAPAPPPGTNPLRLRAAAFDAAPVPQVVIDGGGRLALANEPARKLLVLSPKDLGRPVQDLELSYRPVELRSCIEQATAKRKPVVLREVPWRETDGQPSFVDVEVAPLTDGAGVIGVSVTFADVTRHRRLQEDLQRANREVESAYEQLQSTNEELETTNEELQSTVEELETTNEELQSTNEELETMNEELQSANEELQTINEELRQRSDELNQANGLLESILTGLHDGVVVLDGDLLVVAWNRQSEELWGLRADEARGQNVLNLDIGLPVEPLRQAIRASLAGETTYQEVRVDAVNRRGRRIQCKVSCTPLMNRGPGTRGVILLMEDQGAGGPANPFDAPPRHPV